MYIHLAHILIFSTFLLYIGIMRENLPGFVYHIMLATGLVVIVYHIYKSVFKKDAWVNYIHIFLVGPLLVYIGLQREKTARKWFELVMMLAFASMGYHGYYLLGDDS
jgi:hypothetical protein